MSHRMTKLDVVEVCRAGGLEVSASRAEAWKRAANQGKRRYTPITEAEFEAFTAGLVEWARTAYAAD